jgi:outer membrane protein TolC
MARVVATYARVLSRHQVLLAHESRLTALGAERTRVEQRLEVGRAARLEILRTSAAVAGAEADRVRFAEALDTAERELARLIGTDPGATRARQLVAFDLSQPPGDRAQFLEVALARNPGVASARQRVATADTAIVLADTTRQPRVSLTGRLTDFGSAVGHFTNEWSTGVQLAYPLLDGGAARTRVARAQAGRDVARARLRLATTDVGTSLDRTLSAAREADARATSLGAAIAQFEEITRIEQLRLDEGVGTLTDYLLAEAELLGARAGLVEARYATLAARVELARVTGQLELPWLRQYLRTAS